MRITDVVVNPQKTTMEGRQMGTQNTIQCALFYKAERIYTKYRCLRVCQRLLESGNCYEFIIETGIINIPATKH